MRSKEEAHDYRYFPEPDLPPLTVTEALLDEQRRKMPELPEARRRRFIEEYGLSVDDAAQLIDSRPMADYFEAAARSSASPKAAANWILNELARELKNSGIAINASPVTAESLGSMIRMIDAGTISGKMAKEALVEMYKSGRSCEEVVAEMGGGQVSDVARISELVQAAIAGSPKQLEQYRAGKTTLLGYFVGQVIKSSGGRANPQVVNKLVKEALENGGPSGQ
jgi:aspartyl-tRNA(Asn)/glutamyl-tRNA(Gln) amidotransferase subunit B